MRSRVVLFFKLIIILVVGLVLVIRYETICNKLSAITKVLYSQQFSMASNTTPHNSSTFQMLAIKLSTNSNLGISTNINGVLDLNVSVFSSGKELEIYYEKYMSVNEITCSQSRRSGNQADGGWQICTASVYNMSRPCLVYSFGINNDWSFDDDVSKTYGCTVRAFDPSMKDNNYRRSNDIWFYREGLAGRDKMHGASMWRLNTLMTLGRILNETETTIDYMKIDVEYWEWEALEQATKDGSLRKVKQLGLEVHRNEMHGKPTSVNGYKLYFGVLHGLRDLGFYRWYTHLNPLSITAKSPYTGLKTMCCHEIVFVNTNYLVHPYL